VFVVVVQGLSVLICGIGFSIARGFGSVKRVVDVRKGSGGRMLLENK